MLHAFARKSVPKALVIKACSRVYRRSADPRVGSGTAVAIAFPSSRGSIGDEAMAVALASGLKAHGCTLGLMPYSAHDSWDDLSAFSSIRPQPGHSPIQWWKAARWLRQFDAFGVIGADVLDGYYSDQKSVRSLQLAHLAHKLGLRSVLLGFSYRESPGPNALAYLRDIGPSLKLLTRDPVSGRRISRLAGLNSYAVADLAFLLQPDQSSSRVKSAVDWVHSKRTQKRTVIGLNCNAQVLGRAHPTQAEVLAERFANSANRLASRHSNISFLLIPHDGRGESSDLILARSVWNRLDAKTRAESHLIDQVWRAAEIKAVASYLDFAITGRMHFGIACLGSGVPVASLTYQDKFEGLYELFGIEPVAIPGESATDPGILDGLFEQILNRSAALRSTIAGRLPLVLGLAQANIDHLLGSIVPAESGSRFPLETGHPSDTLRA